jgi:protein-tyrosine phosphatase
MDRKKPAVLFVCLGNICRSPLAEAAFRKEAARLGLEVEVDSAGIGDWHEGEPPDRRAQAVARRHGVDISGCRARQVKPQDFRRFGHIVAMDRENLSALYRLEPSGSEAEISLLLDHVEGREGEAVNDPWYGGPADFEKAWAEVAAGAEALARELAGKP